MRFFKQAFTVILVGLYTIPQRLELGRRRRSSASPASWWCSSACCRSREGFEKAMVNAGRPDRAIVMRRAPTPRCRAASAARKWTSSSRRAGIQKNGAVPVASAEMFVVVDVNRRTTNTGSNVPLRGVDSTLLAVRDEVKIVEGRMLNVRHQRSRGRPCGERAVHRAERRRHVQVRPDSVARGRHLRHGRHGGGNRDLVRRRACFRAHIRRGNSYQSVLAKLESAAVVRRVQGLAVAESAGRRAGQARVRLLPRAITDADGLVQGIG